MAEVQVGPIVTASPSKSDQSDSSQHPHTLPQQIVQKFAGQDIAFSNLEELKSATQNVDPNATVINANDLIFGGVRKLIDNAIIEKPTQNVSAADQKTVRMPSLFKPYEQIGIDQILRTICTSPPYFALQDLEVVSGKTVKAKIFPELEHSAEVGLISAAEAGRHMAILGSCAASLLRGAEKKEYFLATQAEYNFVDGPLKFNGPLQAIATALPMGKHNALSKVNLMDIVTRKRIVTLSVTYQVLSKKIFERMFSEHYLDSREVSSVNPYSRSYKIDRYQISGEILTASVGPISPEDCVGHFQNFPALPVAIIMGILSDSAGLWIKTVRKIDNYSIRFAKISAEALLFSGGMLNIQIQKIEEVYDSIFFACVASNEKGEPIGKMEIECII